MADHPVNLRPLRSASHPAQHATQEQYERLASWLAVWRSFLAVNQTILNELDITTREFAVLLEVHCTAEPEGPTIGMLAERLQIRHNTAVGLVTRMCGKRYVRRSRDERDRRQARVRLTDDGQGILNGLVGAHYQEFREMRVELVRTRSVLRTRITR